MENILNTGLGRQLITSLKGISDALSKLVKSDQVAALEKNLHWKERREMAFQVFLAQVRDGTELIPGYHDSVSMDPEQVAYYARKSFEVVDVFMLQQRLKGEEKP